jgi:cellulose synthase/poly-beta-1,6-N-acetylglucosamine synthase-like glycosyltransferase
VVFIDADTQLEKQSLRHLTAAFRDPEIGAVSGHAKVGNLRTLLTRCQALEYTCGFNLDRRAYDACNAITVVPGAISAARTSVIEAAGGISDDTLAEDTDLTLSMHRLHYRIVYAEKAVAWTEAPEKIRALAKQRFRWAFGTLQCMWKHRDLVFSLEQGWLGFFSLPGVWFFQIGLVALTPLVDILLIISLLLGTGLAILPYFIAFISLDLILALTACVIEKEPWTNALFILPMRIIYRPLLTWVLWTALIRAIKGAWVGWGKLDRTANVTMQG